MKIQAKNTKTKSSFEIKLEKIEVIVERDSKYYFELFKNMYEITSVVTEKDILREFVFIPGKRLINTDKNSGEITIKTGSKNNYFEIDSTKHFFNKNNIFGFETSKHQTDSYICDILFEEFVNNIKTLNNYKFIVSVQNLTPTLVKYFAEK